MGISGLLEKYKKLGLPDETVRVAVQGALRDVCDVEVPLENVSMKRGVVWVSEGPVLRTEIALRQKEILGKLVEELGSRAPTMIR